MKFSDQSTETKSMTVSGILVAVGLVIIGGVFLFLRDPGNITKNEATPVDKLMTSDDVGNIGLEYIKALTLYDAIEEPVILLEKVELLEQNQWLAQYSLKNYGLTVTVQDSQVIHHSVSTMSPNQNLIVFEPEPSQVLSGETLLIKGRMIEASTVSFELVDNAGTTVRQRFLRPQEFNQNLFSTSLNIAGTVAGEYNLVLQAGNDTVTVPIVVANVL